MRVEDENLSITITFIIFRFLGSKKKKKMKIGKQVVAVVVEQQCSGEEQILMDEKAKK